uniref:Peptidase C1A papain C-terminal domain-containing protein n=1 Tax=Panagrolaimus superbus TaxID=310955 RepID=A0A914YEC8_9BILA
MTVVLLVGYTPDFWIAKTSFGPNWGENGYIRFKRGTNFCSMTRRVIAPFLADSILPTTAAITVAKPAITVSGWTEWAASSCTANCGKCGRTIMKRVCRGGICPGANTFNSTTICGASTMCSFPLSSCCAPAKRAVVNSAIICQ